MNRRDFLFSAEGTVRILTILRNNRINAHTMAGIVRDVGLTIEEFRELL